MAWRVEWRQHRQKVIPVDRHGFGFALMEADNSEVGAFLEISILELTIYDMNGVIVKGPRIVDVLPNISDRA